MNQYYDGFNPYQYNNFTNYNAYNPYLKTSLLGSLFGRKSFNSGMYNPKTKINFNSLLVNTQKTLGVINQAIPIVNQVRPIINNAKTMFKIASAVKDTTVSKEEYMKDDNTINKRTTNEKEESDSSSKPTFFL